MSRASAGKSPEEIRALFIQTLETEPGIDESEFARRYGVTAKAVRQALPDAILVDRKNRLTRLLADAMRQAAEDLGTDIHDLRGPQFSAWLRKSDGAMKPHHLAICGGFLRVRDATFPTVAATATQVEKFVHGKYAQHNRKFASSLAEQQLFLVEFKRYAEAWTDKARVLATPPPRPSLTKRTVVAVLSDLHYGANVSASETGYLNFGPTEEARCTAKMAYEVGNYKIEHRDQTELVVCLLGDIVENHLHQLRDAADMAEQVSRAISALLHFFQYVATKYGKITVYCASGNHDRNKHLQSQRAESKKVANSYATIIYDALARALRSHQNISFVIPETAWCLFTAQGNTFYVTHGDTNLDPGSPGNSVNVGSLENQTNRIMAGLGRIDCFIVGHVHISTNVELTNGAILLTNGTMTPVGPFAVNGCNIHRAPTSQWIFESVAGHPVGDARRINFGRKTHEDGSLDALVPPWKGYGR